jgi:hypothetical protein
MEFAICLGVGVLAGGAAMYYIQPQVKLFVAKAFGWEQNLYDQTQDFLVKVRLAKTAAAAKTPPVL